MQRSRGAARVVSCLRRRNYCEAQSSAVCACASYDSTPTAISTCELIADVRRTLSYASCPALSSPVLSSPAYCAVQCTAQYNAQHSTSALTSSALNSTRPLVMQQPDRATLLSVPRLSSRLLSSRLLSSRLFTSLLVSCPLLRVTPSAPRFRDASEARVSFDRPFSRPSALSLIAAARHGIGRERDGTRHTFVYI